MPSFKIIENSIKPEYLEKIKDITLKIHQKNEKFKTEIAETLEQKFWMKIDIEDPRISESPKLI